jgi:D-xylonolactonase
MTVDAEGFVWSATWFGSCIIRFDPDGKEERRLATPAPQTSSVMFGGRDLNELYFTSANEIVPLESGIVPRGYDYQNYLNGYRGGGLFRIKLDIQGREEYRANYPWPQ